ncbi:MAG: glycosyltransferase [Acidimicrobiales bacterium]
MTGGLQGRPFVLYLIDSLAPGGAERSLVDMTPHLVAEGVGLEVAVLHDRPGLRYELESRGVRVHIIDGSSRLAWVSGVTRLLDRLRPDLLHTTLFESDLVGRTAAAFCRVPVVSTLASTPYGPEHATEPGLRKARLLAARAADIATARVVRRFHAVSQAAADACIVRMGLPRERVEVIPRGRDRTRLGEPSPGRRASARSQLGLSPEVPVVLAVARQQPQKGLDLLLRAVPILLRDQPLTQLLVAGGEGRATTDLSGIVADLGIGNLVRFLGERQDVGDLLCAADVFVLPSRREGLPGAVLEAMAMEVPIVASDLPTVREAVPDSEHAILVPVEDPQALALAVSRVLSDSAASADRARAARARFERQFDIVSVSRAMARFYGAALARRT